MAWVRLCAVGEAPAEDQVKETEAAGRALCVAKVGGEVRVLDNLCPHRQGPLGQGWVENGSVVCPWHSWAFDCRTGLAEYPEGERVEVFPTRIEGEEILVEIN